MPMPMGAYSSNGTSSNMREIVPEGYEDFRLKNYTPNQMNLHDQQYEYVGKGNYLDRLASGDLGAYEDMEKPAFQQFNALQGNIASRFSGQGMGARNSSAFQNSLTSASQDFAGQLQANRQKLRRQAILDLMGLSNQILSQKPYETGLAQMPQEEEKGSSGWGGIAGGAIGGLAGMYFGNPMLGAQAGYALGSQF